MKENATKLVSAALLGIDGETVIIGGKAYYISPPTMKRIAGAGFYLSGLMDDASLKDVISSKEQIENITKALSWFIRGDETLYEDLLDGTIEEIATSFEAAVRMLDIGNFLKLSTLVRNVKMAIAKQR